MGYDLINEKLEGLTEEEIQKAADEAYGTYTMDVGAAMNKYYDLVTYPESNWFRCNQRYWPAVLSLAEKYGWEVPEDAKELFRGNDARMPEEVAASLADAIERFLPDIPDAPASDNETDMTITSDQSEESIGDALHEMFGESGNPFEVLAGTQDKLKRLAAFCREGAFEIH